MEIKGRVRCLFEQSGTFKNEFKKMGYEAFDYDIEDRFGQVDLVIDLFKEIEQAYEGQDSLFNSFETNDLLLAFFPCTYFSTMSMMDFTLTKNGTAGWSLRKKTDYALQRLDARSRYHSVLYKLVAVCNEMHLRLVIENPASKPSYLLGGNFPSPTIVDKDRTRRGDTFRKPTAYWFFNCEPTYFLTECKKEAEIVFNARGIDRSKIHPDYARNWIKDFILGTGEKPIPKEKEA